LKRISEISFLFLIILLIATSCVKNKHEANGFIKKGYNDIIARDTLIVAVASNSTDYFIYRGKPMGFQLEILKEFANYLGVELKVVVENSVYKSLAMLITGKCDMVAMSDLSCLPRQAYLSYSQPLANSRLVLVQNGNSKMIKTPEELDGQYIYMVNTGFASRGLSLFNGKGVYNLHTVLLDSIDSEQLLEGISSGNYTYGVVTENLAMLYNDVLNIKIGAVISDSIPLQWVLPASSQQLLDTLNRWIDSNKEKKLFKTKYNKYYRHFSGEYSIDYSEYMTNKGNISPFDDIIKVQSKKIGWDWRLLASLIYQESKFNPLATSWAGAYGIMQLMPQTASLYNINENSDVDDHITAGVAVIATINNNIPESVCDTLDRIRFTLAAYNLGYSHVNDAILLTRKYGYNSDDWNDVSLFLTHLSDPKFYTDSVVSSGYCPGRLTVKFVDEILERYTHYCNILKE